MTLPCSSLRSEWMFIQLTLRSIEVSSTASSESNVHVKSLVPVNVHHWDLGSASAVLECGGSDRPAADQAPHVNAAARNLELQVCFDTTQILSWDVHVFVYSIRRELIIIKASILNKQQ